MEKAIDFYELWVTENAIRDSCHRKQYRAENKWNVTVQKSSNLSFCVTLKSAYHKFCIFFFNFLGFSANRNAPYWVPWKQQKRCFVWVGGTHLMITKQLSLPELINSFYFIFRQMFWLHWSIQIAAWKLTRNGKINIKKHYGRRILDR